MASNEFQRSYVENFLFRESEAKLFVFRKDRNNPISIRDHIMNVKSFLAMLGLNKESKTKLEIFYKYWLVISTDCTRTVFRQFAFDF